jgi:hypothetical protein
LLRKNLKHQHNTEIPAMRGALARIGFTVEAATFIDGSKASRRSGDPWMTDDG